jgi:hypothetical protein
LRGEWSGPDGKGLLSSDQRTRTLRKVLVTYPEVRHVLPDRVSLEAAAAPAVIETLKHFLERQQWLLKSVVVE